MGVRFPSGQERPDFLQVQLAPNQQEGPARQEETQAADRGTLRETRPLEDNAVPESQNNPQKTSPAERAAATAGAQTTGTLIDLLA